MDLINYSLVVFIFIALVVMVWLWQKLSLTAGKLDSEIEALRKWQRDHLPLENWAKFLEYSIGNLPTGIILIDPQLNIKYINSSAEQMVGSTIAQLKGKPYQTNLNLIHESGKPLAEEKDPLLHVFQTRQPMEKQNYKVQNGNMARNLDVAWIPIFNDRNEILGAAVMLLDSSRQKALEEMKVDFVSIVSHEMRTPITAIKGYIDILLRETKLDPEHAEMLRRVYVSNERQLETVESLLNLSRLERGTIPIKPQAFHIEEMVGQIISEVEPQARSKNLEIKFEYPRFALPKVWADPARTREAIVNLCTNAIKYTDEGWVKIDMYTKEGQMCVAVSDSGPGIDKETQSKLFAKFKRGEGALTESKQGVGLGLYITKEFIDLMGGKIWIESEVGHGATFYFTLPLNK